MKSQRHLKNVFRLHSFCTHCLKYGVAMSLLFEDARCAGSVDSTSELYPLTLLDQARMCGQHWLLPQALAFLALSRNKHRDKGNVLSQFKNC